MNDESKDGHWAELAGELGAEPVTDESSTDRDEPVDTGAELSASFEAVEASKKMPDQPAADWGGLANSLGIEPAEPISEGASYKTVEDDVDGTGRSRVDEGSKAPSTVEEVDVNADDSSDANETVLDGDSSLAEIEFAGEGGSNPGESVSGTESKEEKPGKRRRGRRRRGRGRKPGGGDTNAAAAAEDDLEKSSENAELIEDAELVIDDASQESESPSDAADAEPEEQEGDRKRRKRRRRGRRGSRRDGEAATDDGGDESESADNDDEPAVESCDDESQSDNADSGERKTGHRNIPTWEEAVGMVIAPNLDARGKDSKSTSGGKGRGRGGRGRGRKPSTQS
ncbi:MAG: hypothetical protein VB876_00250 [Pirellulales bacterium]